MGMAQSRMKQLLTIAALIYDTVPFRVWVNAPSTDVAWELLSDIARVHGMQAERGWSTASSDIARAAIGAWLAAEYGEDPALFFGDAAASLARYFKEAK